MSPNRVLKRGLTGEDVRLVQEWLCLHAFQVAPDGDFGPATELAVRRFQANQGLRVDGKVGPKTVAALLAPLARATAEVDAGQRGLGRMVVTYARRHLREHPREAGGQNRGPWVRL